VQIKVFLIYATGCLCAIGNVFKTCHDAAENEEGGKIKERRRSGKVNTVAHEVYGPNNQLNVAANGIIGDGLGATSNAKPQNRVTHYKPWPLNWLGVSFWHTWSPGIC
jgi:hypothetical protein